MIRFILNKRLGTRIAGISKTSILIENLLGKFQVRHVNTDGIQEKIRGLSDGIDVPLQSDKETDQRLLQLCQELERKKFVVQSDKEQVTPDISFIYEKLGIEKSDLNKALRENRVLVVSDFSSAGLLLDKLAQRGVSAGLVQQVDSAEDLKDYQLVISLLKDSGDSSSMKLFDSYYQESSSYLNIEIQYSGYIVGPLLKKKSAPCLCCLSRRRLESGELRVSQMDECQIDNIILENLFNLTVLETIRTLTQNENLHLLSGLFHTDVLNNTTNYHEIWPIPNCSVCNTTLKNPRSLYET